MGWRVANSLLTLRDQVNAKWPDRSKASDGTIGDAAHASRSSDHNPWVKDGNTGVVTALDITHDPSHGVDCNNIAEAVKTDPRVKYVIWNRKIWNPSKSLSWRNYTGSNPHTKHVHISVKSDKASYDNTSPWNIGAGAPVSVPSRPDTASQKPLLRKGSRGDDVKEAQTLLGGLDVDGIFGPKTDGAVREFQKAEGLAVDGIIGPYTWGELLT